MTDTKAEFLSETASIFEVKDPKSNHFVVLEKLPGEAYSPERHHIEHF